MGKNVKWTIMNSVEVKFEIFFISLVIYLFCFLFVERNRKYYPLVIGSSHRNVNEKRITQWMHTLEKL